MGTCAWSSLRAAGVDVPPPVLDRDHRDRPGPAARGRLCGARTRSALGARAASCARTTRARTSPASRYGHRRARVLVSAGDARIRARRRPSPARAANLSACGACSTPRGAARREAARRPARASLTTERPARARRLCRHATTSSRRPACSPRALGDAPSNRHARRARRRLLARHALPAPATQVDEHDRRGATRSTARMAARLAAGDDLSRRLPQANSPPVALGVRTGRARSSRASGAA